MGVIWSARWTLALQGNQDTRNMEYGAALFNVGLGAVACVCVLYFGH
jgi:hypothetical protein